MQSDNTQAVLLIPADLGLIENYDATVQPERVTNDSLQAGAIYLRATLNEMVQIVQLCKSMEANHRELLRDTKAQYDNLNRRKKELEFLEDRRSLFRLFKFIAIKRAKREFRDNTRELWRSTRTTSEMLKRTMASTPSENLAPVESESIRRGQRILGLAVALPPPGEMDAPGNQEGLAAVQEMASILASSGNPFADPASSSSLDGQSSTASSIFDSEASSSTRSSVSTSPSSPGSVSSFSWLNFNLNIINNVDSNAPGITISNNGSQTSGSSISDHHSSVNSPPS